MLSNYAEMLLNAICVTVQAELCSFNVRSPWSQHRLVSSQFIVWRHCFRKSSRSVSSWSNFAVSASAVNVCVCCELYSQMTSLP